MIVRRGARAAGLFGILDGHAPVSRARVHQGHAERRQGEESRQAGDHQPPHQVLASPDALNRATEGVNVT